jgi:hypothetical protein
VHRPDTTILPADVTEPEGRGVIERFMQARKE